MQCVWEYEELATNVELHVQKLLEEFNYDTIGNFIAMYRAFTAGSYTSFHEFFQSYVPPITSKHHTCVGLALELWTKLYELNVRFPNLTDHLFLVSCEETIEMLTEYAALSDRLDSVAYSLEKEHVLLALKFEIDNRSGVLLCDPGYHVGRVITVMCDGIYPHTGRFIQDDDPASTKEYSYQFTSTSDKFVEWHSRTIRNSTVQEDSISLIYVSRPYLTAVDVTERRNLVYNFRSLLSRDPKGHLVAGVYFKIRQSSDEFTVFYREHGKKQRRKLGFSTLRDVEKVDEETLRVVNLCGEQLNLPEFCLLSVLMELAKILDDGPFVKELLAVNDNINVMAEDN